MHDNADSLTLLHEPKFKLPKLTASKIQEANQFIADPSAALKLILQKQAHKYPNSHRTIENGNTQPNKIHLAKNRTITLED